MKYLLPLLLFSFTAQAAHSVPMDPEHVDVLMAWAAAATHRHADHSPPVYLVDDWFVFQKMVCKHRTNGCALGVAAGVYIPSDQMVIINTSVIKGPIDAIVVHELVHHLQHKQNDGRDCIDREVEAYQAQSLYSGDDLDVYYRAEESCTL